MVVLVMFDMLDELEAYNIGELNQSIISIIEGIDQFQFQLVQL